MNKTQIKIALSLWQQSFSHLFWPNQCLTCGQTINVSGDYLCQNCWNNLLESSANEYCTHCGRDVSRYAIVGDRCPHCQNKKFFFDRIARCGSYEKTFRQIILALKNQRTEFDRLLAQLAQAALDGNRFAEKIDFFVPVPLHWTRRLQRGYNQSEILAKKIKATRHKLNTDLVRIKRTKPQSAKTSFPAREKNVADAFAIRKNHKFKGSIVCLIDDIKTSGATLNECARTLKSAGAEKVFALVLAVAGQDSD